MADWQQRAERNYRRIEAFYLSKGRSEEQWQAVSQHPAKFNRVWRVMLRCPAGDSPPPPRDPGEVAAAQERLETYKAEYERMKAISNNQITTGMSEAEAIKSWGYPDKVNQSSSGDQWIYRRGRFSNQYLYFKNGKLTYWSEN